ncbi:PilZ domain-containing protein [Bradyrhizobium liaoningense]|uniref:PilZ domain-containing protein n=1 Tax=Bradyrhizobium liaoningense TaxID=43992 RepID=UPI001BA50BD9|nr:PilZ domain-containing protein [Bradyrhizobium liaoningense]MBR0820428.1 PilZ domain-containing protein [Bradyrhizobium liaoningense]
MVETRHAPRFRVAMPAQIECRRDKIPCVIRNISTSGAALQLQESTDRIPVAFALIVLDSALKLPCRVVWRAPFRIGVMFV